MLLKKQALVDIIREELNTYGSDEKIAENIVSALEIDIRKTVERTISDILYWLTMPLGKTKIPSLEAFRNNLLSAKDLKDKIQRSLVRELLGEVKPEIARVIEGEEFIDAIIDRINRKQLFTHD